MKNYNEYLWKRLEELETADTPRVADLSEQLKVDVLEGREATDVGLVFRSLSSLLARRNDLRVPALFAILDSILLSAQTDGVGNTALQELVQNVVRGHLALWLDRLEKPVQPHDAILALNALSHYAPEGPRIRTAALALVGALPFASEFWYTAFYAARRILTAESDWKHLLRILQSRIHIEPDADRKTSPWPPIMVVVSVAVLPYVERRESIYAQLDEFDPGDVLEEARHLSRKIQIPLITRLVERLDQSFGSGALWGLRDIYYLLRAIYDYGPNEPDYTAEVGRVMFDLKAPPPPPPELSGEVVSAFGAIFKSGRLWATETNLLQCYGLASDRDGFATWLRSIGGNAPG